MRQIRHRSFITSLNDASKFINTHISILYLTCRLKRSLSHKTASSLGYMFSLKTYCANVSYLRVSPPLFVRCKFVNKNKFFRNDIRVNKRASGDARQVGAASYPGISAFTRCLATTLSAATTSVRTRLVQQGEERRAVFSLASALCFCCTVCTQVH